MKRAVAYRPQIADLTFQAYDHSLHPEFFETIAAKEFKNEEFSATIRMTPAGHVFEWRLIGVSVVEFLAEQSSSLPENHHLFGHRIGGERHESFNFGGGIRYQTCFQVERLPPEAFFHWSTELKESGQATGFLYELHPFDRLGLSPISLVDLQFRPGSLHLSAYHTFPDEYAVVKTITLIDF